MFNRCLMFVLATIYLCASSSFCFSQENQNKGRRHGEVVYETTVQESTKYEHSIYDNTFYEKTVYEIDINQYEFSEYIDNIYVTILRTQNYINERVNRERQLKVGEITANLAIGVVVTIPILLVVPPMKVVTGILIGMAIDAAISGTISYIESGADTRETLYGAIEGTADGFKWGAIASLAMEYISVAARSARNTGRTAGVAVNYADEAVVASKGLTRRTDDIANNIPVKKEIQIPVRLVSIDDARSVVIPNDVKNIFRSLPDSKLPPRGYSVFDFDNTKRLLPARNARGEVISYSMYISKNGEKVVAGSDGVLYYISGDRIVPFKDIPEFRSRRGNRPINVDYVGESYPDGVYYAERIIYTGNGKLARWGGPIFDDASKYEVILSGNLYQATDAVQFTECFRQLQQWVNANPEMAAKRFTQNEIEMLKTTGRIRGYTWHHTAEPGRMQLVPTELHEYHRHTGGREIWGGGGSRR